MRTYFVVFVTSSLQDNSSFCCSCKGVTPNAKLCGDWGEGFIQTVLSIFFVYVFVLA